MGYTLKVYQVILLYLIFAVLIYMYLELRRTRRILENIAEPEIIPIKIANQEANPNRVFENLRFETKPVPKKRVLKSKKK